MPHTSHALVGEWLAHLERDGKSPHTLAGYARALRHFARCNRQTYGQPFDPALIIPRDVHDWKAHQQSVEHAKPATINQRLVALSRFYRWATAKGHLRNDPTAEVKGVRRDKHQPKALGKGQVRRLLRHVHAAGDARDAAMVELLLGAGLRVEELLELKRGDVAAGERNGAVVVRKGKNEVYREVPLTPPVRRALRAYLAVYPDLSADDPLWVGQRGPLRSRSGVWRMLKKYARMARVDEQAVSAHVLRHTFAKRYLDENPGDLRNLAAILGHASIETTMIYTEPTTDDLAARMEKAEQ